MDASEITFSLGFVQWLITAGVGIYAWYIGKQSASVRETIELRERLVALEGAMREVPSQQMMAIVTNKLERLDAEIGSTNKHLNALNASVNRISDFLMNNK